MQDPRALSTCYSAGFRSISSNAVMGTRIRLPTITDGISPRRTAAYAAFREIPRSFATSETLSVSFWMLFDVVNFRNLVYGLDGKGGC